MLMTQRQQKQQKTKINKTHSTSLKIQIIETSKTKIKKDPHPKDIIQQNPQKTF